MLLLLTVIFIPLLTLYCIYKPPSLLIRYFSHRWPDVLFHAPSTRSKTIALTIDDGPSQYTDSIIQVLKENNAHATFFIIGSQVHGHETTLQNLVRAGHELGNHAMRDEPSRSLSDTALASEIATVEGMILAAYASTNHAAPPKYFRPGSGFFSTAMRALVRRLGYRLVLGSIYPHDPQIPYPAVNARHVLSMLRPGGIVICHDRRQWTVPMLRVVLPEMRRRGWRVVTVTELLREAGDVARG
ncbi:hypothetical protein M8818_001066 [Zalaria obscura]|uniref:Uncharacterized protein n=1 Tax=Zalaria obscura TaxID=2024903 RepID=A0ACC3SQG7_9PEZI